MRGQWGNKSYGVLQDEGGPSHLLFIIHHNSKCAIVVCHLLLQVAEEHGLEVQIGLPGAATAVAPTAAAAAAEPDLNARLAELKGAR